MDEHEDYQWRLDSIAKDALVQFVQKTIADVPAHDLLNDLTTPEVDELNDDDWDKVLDLIETALVVIEVGWRG